MTIRIDNRLCDCPIASVACRRCGGCVLVRKGSWNQTSVQWNAEASTGCLERRDTQNLAAYSGQRVFLGCSALAASIVDAVRHGDLPVADDTVHAAT